MGRLTWLALGVLLAFSAVPAHAQNRAACGILGCPIPTPTYQNGYAGYNQRDFIWRAVPTPTPDNAYGQGLGDCRRMPGYVPYYGTNSGIYNGQPCGGGFRPNSPYYGGIMQDPPNYGYYGY